MTSNVEKSWTVIWKKKLTDFRDLIKSMSSQTQWSFLAVIPIQMAEKKSATLGTTDCLRNYASSLGW